ncbi:MAG TPA: LuxR C-terminal-related transcriptional regulator [Chthonomonadaceae bacterium]|nr:LuxR C-terminal-related transcriptional regulator [Chthonomonadaceae bacterium]
MQQKRRSMHKQADYDPGPSFSTGPPPKFGDDGDASLLTTLQRAAEALAAPRCPADPNRPIAIPAEPEGITGMEAPDDYQRLVQVLCQIQALMGTEEKFAAQSSALFEACSQGIGLHFLLCSLLPPRKTPRVLGEDGKPLLSKREIEVLREAGKGYPYPLIADILNMAPRTVETHFQHIYRKLGRRTPLHAVVRAAELGYLEKEAVQLLEFGTVDSGRNFTRFDTLCHHGGDIDRALEAVGLRPLVEFGLLLLSISSLAARYISSYEQIYQKQGIVCALDRSGNVVRCFGQEQMGIARCIVIAPPHAAEAGFTPGNLFIAHDYVPQRALNRGAIAEFTPQGQFVRAFCGGPEINTRLIGPLNLAFAADGALLATSGILTDAILRFDQGGRRVRRWIEGVHNDVGVGSTGQIYTIRPETDKSTIAIYTPNGSYLGRLGPVHKYELYKLAIHSCGHVYVSRNAKGRCEVHVYDPKGDKLDSWYPGGLNDGRLALDEWDRLYVCCSESQDLKILAPDGTVERRFDLRGRLKPWAVAPGPNGQIYVCGKAL